MPRTLSALLASSTRVTVICFLLLCSLASSGSAQLPTDHCFQEGGRDPDKAIRYCTEAIDSGRLTNYELVHSLNTRGWAYYRKGDYDRAIHDYDQAIQLKSDYAFAFNNRGLAYSAEGDYRRAIENYSAAIRLKPDYALALNNRGLAYSSQHDAEHAIQDFDEAIELRPDNAETFYNRGRAYAGTDDFERAIKDFTRAIQLKPDYAEAFKERSNAHEFRHEEESALQDINRAIELRPNDADAISVRGSMYDQKGNYDRAVRDFSKALQLKPEEVFTLWLRAMALYDKGDYAAAILDYNEVIKLQPEVNVVNVSEIYQRGLAYLYKGDYVGAIRDFNEVANLQLSWGFYHRGLAHFFMGQFEAAKGDFDGAGEDPYTDIWTYLAEAKLGQKAKAELQDKAPRLNEQLKHWPSSVIGFYLGSLTSAQVLSDARADDLADKNPCCEEPTSLNEKVHYHFSEGAAYFYLGEDMLLHGHSEEARTLFQKALLMAAKNTEEYHGSVVELNRMKTGALKKPSSK
jgi:tetratricopeptide (TPR) repeat protein